MPKRSSLSRPALRACLRHSCSRQCGSSPPRPFVALGQLLPLCTLPHAARYRHRLGNVVLVKLLSNCLGGAGMVGLWEMCLQQACELQASLHQGWWCQGLADDLPSSTPAAYHLAWQLEPRWQGGPPDSILVATDGSGENNGAWAFVAWGMSKGRWRRMGWAAATLPATPWLAGSARE